MKLVIGCGYLGLRVARRWRDAGERVATVTRSGQRAELLAGEGFEPIVADVAHRDTLVGLPAADGVLYAVGYDRGEHLTHRQVYVGGLENVLAAVADSPAGEALRRFVYVSTTGVYAGGVYAGGGHAGGEGDWIDEDSACEPRTPGAQAHLEAERLLAASGLAERAVVLRMAGLYGHERVPRRDELAAGRPIAAASDGVINLIHVDDAAAVVVAAEARAAPPVTLNVADGCPVNRREYLEEVARLAGAPRPQFVEPGPNAPRGRGSASKRIDNRRLMAALEVALAYPTYREGLAAALGAMRANCTRG